MTAKRPKDMTDAEKRALPIARRWDIVGPTGPVERDDVMLWSDEDGAAWSFGQRRDGSWFRIPCHF